MKYSGKIVDPKDLVTKEYVDDADALKVPMSAQPTVPSVPTNLNTLFDTGLYAVKDVSTGKPTPSNFYGGVLVFPYNVVSGKTSTQFTAQLAATTGDYSGGVSGLYYRDSLASAWNSWRKIAFTDQIPTVPTNVSAFTNDAGYLTAHQDISGKADLSGASFAGTINVANKAIMDTNGYVTGTWLKTTSSTVNNSKLNVCVLSGGWIYQQTPEQLRVNMGAGTYSKPDDGIPDSDIASASTWNNKQNTISMNNPINSKCVINVQTSEHFEDETVETSLEILYSMADAKYTKPSTGIPKSDLASAVQSGLHTVVTPTFPDVGKLVETIDDKYISAKYDEYGNKIIDEYATKTALSAKYTKPSGGIPDSDIASASTWNAKLSDAPSDNKDYVRRNATWVELSGASVEAYTSAEVETLWNSL